METNSNENLVTTTDAFELSMLCGLEETVFTSTDATAEAKAITGAVGEAGYSFSEKSFDALVKIVDIEIGERRGGLLVEIAEAIADDAAEEYFESNSAAPSLYASSAMGAEISEGESSAIATALKAWADDGRGEASAWDVLVTRPLQAYAEAQDY